MKALVNGKLVEVADPTPEQIEAGKAAAAARPARLARPVPGIEFLARFTLAEYAGIHTAATNSPQLAYWMDMVRVQSSVTIGSETALQAKAFLIASGLLTQQRADVIFS